MKGIKILVLALGLLLFSQAAEVDWTASQRLTMTLGSSKVPAIAIDSSDDLHVVWSDDSPGHAELYYKKGLDGGAAWTPSRRLTWTFNGGLDPAIAVDSLGTVHLVDSGSTPSGNYEIYHKKSPDGGVTWSSHRRITWTSGLSSSPAIAVDSEDNLHLVWEDSGSGAVRDIYYKKSTNGGNTWTSAQRLTMTSGWSYKPAIAVDSSDNLHIVWYDDTPGNQEIYYKKGANGGTTWTPAQRLILTPGSSQDPAIAVDSADNLHIVWSDDTPGNQEIYYKKGTNGGATWTSAQKLSVTGGSSSDPAIAVDSSDNLHIVWSDETPGLAEIYYKGGTDGGAAWASTQRLTWTTGSSADPAMAVDSSGNLQLVWGDDTPGNEEIYYKKGAGTTPVVQPGEWTATADFGTFDFVVSPDSQYITEITYKFSNFSCGGIILNGGLSISTSPGWPISNLSFEIENYLDPAHNQLFTVQGTFSNSGDQASGTWEAEFYGSTCSGSWQGSPKT